MSRKRWSDLFLAAAVLSLILVFVSTANSRVLFALAFPCFLTVAALARRRMVKRILPVKLLGEGSAWRLPADEL